MKRRIILLYITIAVLLIKVSTVSANSFTSGVIPMCDTTEFTVFNNHYEILAFTTGGPQLGYISLSITSNHPQTLKIILKSPQGTTLLLSAFNGNGGQNYTNCNIVNYAAPNITTGNAPFTGDWRPQEAIGFPKFDGEQAYGIWSIVIIDTACTNTGGSGWVNGYFNGTNAFTIINSCGDMAYPNSYVSICSGTSIDLTVGIMGATLVWVSSPNPTAETVPGTYHVYFENFFCQHAFFITLSLLPKPSLGPDKTIRICDSIANLNSLVLDTSLTKSWSFNGLPISNSAASSITQPGNYRLIATNSNSCKDTVDYNIIFDSNFDLGLNSNSTRCSNQTINLTGLYNTSGVTSTWYFNNNIYNHADSVYQNGAYTLIASNNFGCHDTALVSVSTLASQLLGPNQIIKICYGDSIDLTNTFDTTDITNSTWYLNQNQVPTPTNVFANSNYSCIASFNIGCIDTASINVVVNQNNTLGANQSISICANQTTNLNNNLQTTGNTVEWYLNSTLVTNPTNVSTPGDYLILVTDTNGCKDSCIKTVTIKNTPSLGSDQTIVECSNNSVDLTQLYNTSGYFSVWMLGSNIVSIPTSVSNSGIYSLIALSNNGCSDTANVNLTFHPSIMLGNDLNISICEGTTINLNTLYLIGTNTATWYSDSSILSNVSSIGTPGIYTIVATTSFGCSDTSNVTLNINPKPFLGNDTTISVCSYSTANLTSYFNLSTNTNLWYANGASISSPINVSNPGNYTVYTIDSHGCKDTATIYLNQLSPPSLGIDQAHSICSDSSINLNALINTTNLSGNWTYNSTVVTNPSNVNSPGNYNLIATNTDGCSDTVNVSLAVNPIPNPGQAQTLSVCQGQSLNLNSYFNITNETVSWSYNGQVIQDVSAVQDSGNYNIQLTNSNGCIATSSAIVTILPKPEIGPTTTITNCSGTTLNLTTLYNLSGMTSSWEYNGNNISNPISVNQAGTYQVIAIDQNGCTDTAQILLDFYIGPDLGPDLNYSLCAWQSLDLSSLFSISGVTAQYFFNGIPISNYTSVNDSGQYQIVVTDINGCKDTMNINYTIVDCICSADFKYNTTCIDDPIQFEIFGDSTIINTHWQFSQQGINDSYENNPSILLPKPTELTITVTVTLSCGIDTITKTINFENCFKKCKLFIPSAFTPNKDGFNDLFKTESYCEPEYFRMRILNRLGKIVFSSDNYNNTWDGTIEGTLQEEGIYLYIIEYVFPNQIRAVEKNTFTLLR